MAETSLTVDDMQRMLAEYLAKVQPSPKVDRQLMLFGLNLYQMFTLSTYSFFSGDLAFIDKIPGAPQSPRWNLRLHEAAEFARISIRNYSTGTHLSENLRRPLPLKEVEHLFLDIFGSPVNQLAESVRTQQVLDLANTAYENYRQDATLDGERLAILSDALEEAGLEPEVQCPACRVRGGYLQKSGIQDRCGRCDFGKARNPVLEHLRSPGPHYVGCWAVDLVRGV